MYPIVFDLVWIKSKVVSGKPDNLTFWIDNISSLTLYIRPDQTLIINIDL